LVTHSLCLSNDFINIEIPSDEAIMEVMDSPDMRWEDLHHSTSFLPDLEQFEDDIQNLVATRHCYVVNWVGCH
jgi:hypothetical protein